MLKKKHKIGKQAEYHQNSPPESFRETNWKANEPALSLEFQSITLCLGSTKYSSWLTTWPRTGNRHISKFRITQAKSPYEQVAISERGADPWLTSSGVHVADPCLTSSGVHVL